MGFSYVMVIFFCFDVGFQGERVIRKRERYEKLQIVQERWEFKVVDKVGVEEVVIIVNKISIIKEKFNINRKCVLILFIKGFIL